LYACSFRIYFTPLPGFFSPFPHGTGSLSVDHEYLALEDGPPIFEQDFTCPALLVPRLVSLPRFRIRGYHPLWPDFPDRSARSLAKSCRLFRFRSPLLSESRLFSLPVGTEMFHFPTFPPSALCVQAMVAGLSSSWVSPFGNPRITARLPTPRGLSQAPTSFFGSWCQGIHHVLLVACRHKDARVHCVVLNMRAVPTRNPACRRVR
jgi:hypothetical protein